MNRCLAIMVLVTEILAFSGCRTSHEVEVKPMEIKPIHITIDVNVRVEKALDSFFDDLEAAENQIKKE